MDSSDVFLGVVLGGGVWFVIRCIVRGFFTVNQNERAVKTRFGRADRLYSLDTLQNPAAIELKDDERERYDFPTVRVLPPGGPYFQWPWERVLKVDVATQTLSMAFDPESRSANQGGTVLEAVTKDQLNTGLTGQIRFRVSEQNLYAYLFGVKRPIAHVMGYYISILRERIAAFSAPTKALPEGTLPTDLALVDPNIIGAVSINDLRKNLRSLNEHMEQECKSSIGRYGMAFDVSLITGIDPPTEVESALAAINTAHNQVSSDISLAQAGADQRIVLSRRAVEVETLKARAEVEPLTALATQLSELKKSGPGALDAYIRNVRLGLFAKAKQILLGGRS